MAHSSDDFSLLSFDRGSKQVGRWHRSRSEESFAEVETLAGWRCPPNRSESLAILGASLEKAGEGGTVGDEQRKQRRGNVHGVSRVETLLPQPAGLSGSALRSVPSRCVFSLAASAVWIRGSRCVSV